MITTKLTQKQPAIMLAAFVGLTLACWGYLWFGAGVGMNIWSTSTLQFPLPANASMNEMASEPMQNIAPQKPAILATLIMWWIMMLAMMLPGSILQAASAAAKRTPSNFSFFLGYSLVWLGFSVVATGLQVWLTQIGSLDANQMWSTSNYLSLFLLCGAALYQFLPAKRKALAQCATISNTYATQNMGLRYGFHCLIASVPMMTLLFVGGIMNLYWIFGLSLISALEKFIERNWFMYLIGLVIAFLAIKQLLTE